MKWHMVGMILQLNFLFSVKHSSITGYNFLLISIPPVCCFMFTNVLLNLFGAKYYQTIHIGS